MGMAYGTPIPQTTDGPQLRVAETQALERQNPAFEYLWRVEAVSYSVGDELGGWSSTDPRLELFAVSIKHATPTGARLWTGRHVDLREGRKQYACRTVDGALEQFKRRRNAQIRILEHQLRRARAELRLTESWPSRGD